MTRVYAELHGAVKQNSEDIPNGTQSHDSHLHEINALVRHEMNEAKKNLKLSDKALAKMTGLTDSTVNKTLNGDIETPAFDKVFVLYKALGIELPNVRKTPQQTAVFTMQDLIGKLAVMLSYPSVPTEGDRIRVQNILVALDLAGALTLKSL